MDLIVWIILLCGILLFAMLLTSLFYSFSGVWERMDEVSPVVARERIRLAQFGPLVLGNCNVVGGQQSFFGFALGPALWLRRRDRGVPFLAREGFPEAIAKQVEGQIMARYRMRLASDRNFMNGIFIPYRVEFSLQPPRVTAMHAQAAVSRRYRRVELVLDKQVAAAPVATE